MTDPIERKGTKFVTAIPSADGACVAMCEYKGHILLACQYAIYQLSEKEDIFRKIKFEVDVKDWK
jgi:hypothetical protein